MKQNLTAYLLQNYLNSLRKLGPVNRNRKKVR